MKSNQYWTYPSTLQRPEFRGYLGLPLQWRHNENDGVSNHRRLDCLLSRLFRRRSKNTSKSRVTGLCEGNSPVSCEFPHGGPVKRTIFPFDAVDSGFMRPPEINTLVLLCKTNWCYSFEGVPLPVSFFNGLILVNTILFTYVFVFKYG